LHLTFYIAQVLNLLHPIFLQSSRCDVNLHFLHPEAYSFHF